MQAEKSRTPAYDARRDRLEGFAKSELAALAPLIDQGPVALVEFADIDKDQLPAINIALRVDVNAEQLTRVIVDPANYPKFMPTLDSVNVLAKSDTAIVYEWAFDLAVLQMRGRNTMTIYRPRSGDPKRDAGKAATRITIDSEEGDMGVGRTSIRIYPESAKSSLLVLAMRLDLRQANYVARQVAKAARSINRSANLSLVMSMALNLRREAQRKAGIAASQVPLRGLGKPQVELAKIVPLLQRGDLVFFSMSGDTLNQVSAIGAIDQPVAKVKQVMRDASSFGSALVPGSAAKIVAQKDNITTFDWNINLPLVGVSGQMQMEDQDPLVAIDATSGALKGGRWLFEVQPVGDRATLVTGWARFDFKNSTWLLEKILDADPAFGVGMTGASEVMLVRALRSRSNK